MTLNNNTIINLSLNQNNKLNHLIPEAQTQVKVIEDINLQEDLQTCHKNLMKVIYIHLTNFIEKIYDNSKYPINQAGYPNKDM